MIFPNTRNARPLSMDEVQPEGSLTHELDPYYVPPEEEANNDDPELYHFLRRVSLLVPANAELHTERHTASLHEPIAAARRASSFGRAVRTPAHPHPGLTQAEGRDGPRGFCQALCCRNYVLTSSTGYHCVLLQSYHGRCETLVGHHQRQCSCIED